MDTESDALHDEEHTEIHSTPNADEDLRISQDLSALSCDYINNRSLDDLDIGDQSHSLIISGDREHSNNVSCENSQSDSVNDSEQKCNLNHNSEEQSESLNYQYESYTYSEVVAANILLELQSKCNDSKNENFIKKAEEINVEINKRKTFNFMQLLKSDDDLKIFTGINFQLLKNLTNAVKLCENKRNSGALTVEERIVLCLCKLKLNLSFKCLAVLFSLSRQSASHCFLVTLHTLAFILEKAIYWPSKEQIMKSMPKCFEKFKDTYIILDCTEIPVERPKCLKCRLRLYSHYKGCETVKILIGVSPSGLIIFVSEPFGGRASDKAIFNHSKILEKLEPTRDAIMVDKGFSIEEECAFNRIKLYIPPKLSKNNQLSVEDVTSTVKIASARVHVERAIQRMKLYQILKSKISSNTAPYMNEICKVICGIVNLSNSILDDKRFMK